MHPPSPPQPIPYPPLDKFESALSNLPHTSLCDDALVESIEKARIEVEMEMDDEERTEKKPGDDVVITALGTGSAMPSKFRNGVSLPPRTLLPSYAAYIFSPLIVSATLVQIPKWGNVLLDAGEGTWGQLARHFGASEVNDVIRDLKCVFISHIHGDHHIGLSKILVKRRMVGKLSDSLSKVI
jgi:ribonuclease Z